MNSNEADVLHHLQKEACNLEDKLERGQYVHHTAKEVHMFFYIIFSVLNVILASIAAWLSKENTDSFGLTFLKPDYVAYYSLAVAIISGLTLLFSFKQEGQTHHIFANKYKALREEVYHFRVTQLALELRQTEPILTKAELQSLIDKFWDYAKQKNKLLSEAPDAGLLSGLIGILSFNIRKFFPSWL